MALRLLDGIGSPAEAVRCSRLVLTLSRLVGPYGRPGAAACGALKTERDPDKLMGQVAEGRKRGTSSS